MCCLLLTNSREQKQLLNISNEQVEKALNNMPDFETWIMDDGNGMINLVNGGMFALVKGAC